ncbi:hypothetical protein [Streptomyces sp. NPDC001537]
MTLRQTVRQWATEHGLPTEAGFLIRLGQHASAVYSELAAAYPEFDPGRAKTWETVPGSGRRQVEHWPVGVLPRAHERLLEEDRRRQAEREVWRIRRAARSGRPYDPFEVRR